METRPFSLERRHRFAFQRFARVRGTWAGILLGWTVVVSLVLLATPLRGAAFGAGWLAVWWPIPALAALDLGALSRSKGRAQVRLEAEAVVNAKADGESLSVPWRLVDGVTRKDGCLFLWRKGRRRPRWAIIVPREAFATTEEFGAFVVEARRLWAAAHAQSSPEQPGP